MMKIGSVMCNIPILLVKRGLLKGMSDETYLKWAFKVRVGYSLDLENPKTFNEKIQWLKLYGNKNAYQKLVDKYEAKLVVGKVIGEKYITPTLGVYDNFEEIDFSALPDKFVLKCTHDSGGIVLCKDKQKFDICNAKKVINNCLKTNYFFVGREYPYKSIKHRIIAEEYLENDSDGLHDYKVWCFNGKPLYVQFITGRIGKYTYEGFYGKEWKLQNFSYHNPLVKDMIPEPKCLDELLSLSEKLANIDKFPFVRCDFYVLENGDIRFGEMTFYPMSGFERWKPIEIDKTMGDKIILSKTL